MKDEEKLKKMNQYNLSQINNRNNYKSEIFNMKE